VTDDIVPQRSASQPAVYVLTCCDGTLYTGATTDLRRRLTDHEGPRGAKYTRSRQPVRLLAWWHPPTFSAAKSQEARFKRLSRSAKLAALRDGAAYGCTIFRPRPGADP